MVRGSGVSEPFVSDADKLSIFISYARSDASDFAEYLVVTLRLAGTTSQRVRIGKLASAISSHACDCSCRWQAYLAPEWNRPQTPKQGRTYSSS